MVLGTRVSSKNRSSDRSWAHPSLLSPLDWNTHTGPTSLTFPYLLHLPEGLTSLLYLLPREAVLCPECSRPRPRDPHPAPGLVTYWGAVLPLSHGPSRLIVLETLLPMPRSNPHNPRGSFCGLIEVQSPALWSVILHSLSEGVLGSLAWLSAGFVSLNEEASQIPTCLLPSQPPPQLNILLPSDPGSLPLGCSLPQA